MKKRHFNKDLDIYQLILCEYVNNKWTDLSSSRGCVIDLSFRIIYVNIEGSLHARFIEVP